ncbi:MAG: hypothetical protein F2813_03470 [Actinobacteria bacterium]|uniref:Unannotated protein n=1 Tax=freshwater metagenome TaxID=449393 RepID=A0A6J5ZNA3_9ZZZZ|nr:hypothetical protein [Actinomycetota bacterium]
MKREAYKVIGYATIHGGRYYLRRRYPNFGRNVLVGAGAIVAAGAAIAVVSAVAGRSDVNPLTP